MAISIRRTARQEAEDEVIATITAHASSLLRAARRHSLCADDAQDAYQRTMEIYLRRAETLEPDAVAGWLHTVCKHEAMAVRKHRMDRIDAAEPDLDAQPATELRDPVDRLAGFERVARSAEALRELKPQEVRALLLKGEGLLPSSFSSFTKARS